MVTSDFRLRSGNMAGSRMRNESDHNYTNSSVIVDLAIGQIPRSIERISSSFSLHVFPCSYSHSHFRSVINQ